MAFLDLLPGVDDANTSRRNATVAAFYIVAGLVTVDLAMDDTTGEPAEEPAPAALNAISQQPDWLQGRASVQGRGAAVTDAFHASRFTTFRFDYGGTGHFSVELVDAEAAETVAVLVDGSGAVSETVGIGVPSGEYVLEVDAEADADWEIEFGEPAAPPEGRHELPVSIDGSESEIFGKLIAHDEVTVRANHDGTGAFVVRAWDEANTDGTADETIFEEVGEVDAETSVHLGGLLYLSVEADGTYWLEIE